MATHFNISPFLSEMLRRWITPHITSPMIFATNLFDKIT
jgi:hypothetical protein